MFRNFFAEGAVSQPNRIFASRLLLAASLVLMGTVFPEGALDGATDSLWIVSIFVLILAVLEAWRPAETSLQVNESGSDVPYFLIENFGVSGIALGLVLSPLAQALPPSPMNLPDLLQGLPLLVSAVIQLFIFDGIDTIRHRIEHHVGWLWDYHQVHHSQTFMNFMTFDRNHIVSLLYNGVVYATTGHFLGLEPFELFSLLVIVNFMEYLTHANVRLSYGAFLDRILVCPLYHRTHHAVREEFSRKPYGNNFANIFPFWDIIFGTAAFDYSTTHTGIYGESAAQGGGGYLTHQLSGFQRTARRLRKLMTKHCGDHHG